MALQRGFASDNASGVHPKILSAIAKANKGHAAGYGEDRLTAACIKEFKKHFGKDATPFLVFNGTAANVLAIAAMVEPFNAVICPASAHLNAHECGAAERFAGCKLITIGSEDGKITVEQVKAHIHGVGSPHYVQPKVISITQPTECGTLYTLAEMRQLAEYAHLHKMLLHVDGARLSNAAASLNANLKEITADVGVDALSFGGTKNGLLGGDAVVFFRPGLAENFEYIRKQGMQLASKMRFLSAEFIALLSNGLWLENAKHSNRIAKMLEKELSAIPGTVITRKVEANIVFALLPKKSIDLLMEKYGFHVWDEKKGEVRLVASYDSTKEDVRGFVRDLKRSLEKM